ncbi:MAG: serine/threonine-protein kinase rio2-like [Nitrososphaeraceae archaeon]|nr:serine/threonine-protein kinase rio2-like [Nitrososphaeraceae archaeon]
MSSVQSVAKLIKVLEADDHKILAALSSVISRHKFLNREQLAVSAKMHRDTIDFRISRLRGFRLISSNSEGTHLLMAGMDAVALKKFVDRSIIEGLGMPIGVGKESDVFEAITGDRQTRAIKFFRIGRTSFRQVKRKRSFVDDRYSHDWLLTNIQAAETEYAILHKLQHKGVAIPTPHFRWLHAIVMSRINGVKLVESKDLQNPRQALFDILRDVRIAYEHHVINCDLSEYNIMVDTDNRPWIIDWPQSVSRSHPNAGNLVKRDISNVVSFFNRRFHLEISNTDALRRVLE